VIAMRWLRPFRCLAAAVVAIAVVATAAFAQPKLVTVSKSKFPETAKHIQDAQRAGHPSTLTVARASAAANRDQALKGTPPKSGKDRDEYPPAMFKEGGKGASVRYVDPKDNQGAGASIGAQCRDVKDGGKVTIKVVD
jgi:hypothetical protein